MKTNARGGLSIINDGPRVTQNFFFFFYLKPLKEKKLPYLLLFFFERPKGQPGLGHHRTIIETLLNKIFLFLKTQKIVFFSLSWKRNGIYEIKHRGYLRHVRDARKKRNNSGAFWTRRKKKKVCSHTSVFFFGPFGVRLNFLAEREKNCIRNQFGPHRN